MRMLLIRHGQTRSNQLGLLDTAPPGPELSLLGREQAERLADLLADEPIEAVVASTARRAQETATPLARRRGLTVEVVDGLAEVAAGDWEMTGDPDLVRSYLDTLGHWMVGDLERRTPGPNGESGAELFARVDTAMAALVARGLPTLAVVAHGALLRTWASVRAVNLPADFGAGRPLGNTGVIILDRPDSDPATGWTCLSWTGQPDPLVAPPGTTGDPGAGPIPVP